MESGWKMPMKSLEKQTSIERGPQIYDAIHFINYEIIGENNNKRPRTQGLMSMNAIAHLLEAGVTKNVVIAGVIRYGKDQDLVSKFYADFFRKRLAHRLLAKDKNLKEKIMARFSLDEKELEANLTADPVSKVVHAVIAEVGINIIAEAELLPVNQVSKGAVETGGEVDFMLDQARQHNWKSILTIGYEPHLQRIKNLYERRGEDFGFKNLDFSEDTKNEQKISFKSSGQLLKHTYPGFTSKFEKSPFRVNEGNSFEKGEALKIGFMRFDRKGNLISWLAHHLGDKLKQKLHSEQHSEPRKKS